MCRYVENCVRGRTERNRGISAEGNCGDARGDILYKNEGNNMNRSSREICREIVLEQRNSRMATCVISTGPVIFSWMAWTPNKAIRDQREFGCQSAEPLRRSESAGKTLVLIRKISSLVSALEYCC